MPPEDQPCQKRCSKKELLSSINTKNKTPGCKNLRDFKSFGVANIQNFLTCYYFKSELPVKNNYVLTRDFRRIAGRARLQPTFVNPYTQEACDYMVSWRVAGLPGKLGGSKDRNLELIMAPVLISGVAEHILDVPSAYPGPHNFTQERTDPDLLPLDPRSQLLLVWDCMCDWIKQQLQQGNGVTAKGFGSFTFERTVHKLPPVIPELNHVGKEAEAVEPRFVMAAELAAEVHRQPSTNMLEKNHSKGSIFQTKNMKFLNPVPIGAACFLETAVVASALRAFFSAIPQLIGNNYDLALDFKFCRVWIQNKKMSCNFDTSLKKLAQATLDSKRANGPIPVKSSWSRCADVNAMASFLRHPKQPEGKLPAATAPTVSQRIAQMRLQQVDNLSIVTSATVSKSHT